MREKACNEMNWQKCEGCTFLVDATQWGNQSAEYICRITGKFLTLRDCVKAGLHQKLNSQE